MIDVKEHQREFEWISAISSTYREKCIRCGTIIETEERFGPSGLLGIKTEVIGKEPVTNKEKETKARDDAKRFIAKITYLFTIAITLILWWIFYMKR
jgi:hypothetical protein